jgi:poly(3-hydroxybutyrate) depolymerase
VAAGREGRRALRPTRSARQLLEAELYRVEGGGHSWPGSELLANVENVVGHTTMSISTNEVMWEFLEQHPLVASGGES